MAAKTPRPIIVQVVESFGGGVFQSTSQLCMGLSDSADFVIIHGIRTETPANFEAAFPKGTRFIHLEMGRAINPAKDLPLALKLRKIILGLKPHAVQAQSSKAGAITRLAMAGTRVPVFYSPRGYGFLMNASAPKKAVYWLAERLLGLIPATTVACGYGELTPAKWVSFKTALIPNGIAPESINDTQRPALKTNLHVVTSGRISPQKNFPLFCEIASRFLNHNVKFTWIGGGDIPEGTIIPSNVNLTGWLPHAESLEQLNKGHVYLHMSRWEGLSRIVLEAMAHGFPLILSDIPGNRELATPQNGYLCTTAQEASAAINDLLADPKKIQTLGAQSRHMVETTYNWHNSLKAWSKLYGLAR